MKLAIHLAAISAVTLVIAFLTNLYVMTAIGPGFRTDAFFASGTIPQIVLAVLGGSLGHVLVPLLTVQRSQDFSQLAWTYFFLVLLVFAGLSTIFYLSAEFWIPIAVPGFSPEAEQLTIELVRIQLIGMIFTGVSAVLLAAYQARQRYVRPEVVPLITAVVALAALLWALPRHGIHAVAWITVIRSAANAVCLLPGLGSFSAPRFSTPEVVEAWRRLRPLIGGSAYYKLGPLVDRFLASMAPPGSLSLLHFAQQLFNIVGLIINKAITGPMVPLLSKHAESQRWSTYRWLYNKRLALILVFTSFAYLALLWVGEPVLTAFLGYGRFTPDDLEQLLYLLLALGGVLIGGGLGQVISPAFYAKGNTVTPTKVAIIGFTIGILLEVAGFFAFGVVGIAGGLSAYYLLNATALYILLEKELNAQCWAQRAI